MDNWDKAAQAIAQLDRITKSFSVSLENSPKFIQIYQGVQGIQRVLVGLAEPMRRLAELIKPYLTHEYLIQLSEFPQRTRQAFVTMANMGWFPDLSVSLPHLNELTEIVNCGTPEDTEVYLANHFDNRVDEIERSIVNRFPKRGGIILGSFNAHRDSYYELSIPVLFAQIDGICKELFDSCLFIKNERTALREALLNEEVDGFFTAIFISPLGEALPIWMTKKERKNIDISLNRHMIMHGESLEYGTHTNSLKVISLLNYVAHALKDDT